MQSTITPSFMPLLAIVVIALIPSCQSFSPSVGQFFQRGVTWSSSTAVFADASNSDASASVSPASASSPSTPTSATKQSQYGTTLDLPETYVKCGRCEAVYALTDDDLGTKNSRGRRLECTVCGHSWFQSKDRLMNVKDGFEMIPLPQNDLDRIELNIKEGKKPKHLGDMKLYVGNIAFECHEDDILEIFSRVGEVGDVSLVRDDEGKNRGFGFVTMRTKDDGEKAMAELDGSTIRGRKIAVRASTN